MNSVAASDTGQVLVFQRPTLYELRQRCPAVENQVKRTHATQGKGCVEHIRRRHSQVQVANSRTDLFPDSFQERDHVMMSAALDLADAVGIGWLDAPQFFHDGSGNNATGCHRFGRRQLNLEPARVDGRIVPETPHLGSRVPGNHRSAGPFEGQFQEDSRRRGWVGHRHFSRLPECPSSTPQQRRDGRTECTLARHERTWRVLAGRGESVVGLVTASWGQMQGGLTQAMP